MTGRLPEIGAASPVPHGGPSSEERASSSQPTEPSIESVVNEAARNTLSAPAAPVPHAEEMDAGWGSIWSLFGWGKPSTPPEVAPVRREITDDEEGAGTSLGESAGESADEPAQDNVVSQTAVQTEMAVAQAAVAPELQIEERISEAAVEGKKGQFEKTTEKTEQVGKWWWQRLGEAIVGKTVIFAKQGIESYAVKYAETVDKPHAVAQAKASMLSHLDDPQFVELFEMVRTLAADTAKVKIGKLESSFIGDLVKGQQGLILDLIEINLAKGFANLAKQTHAMRNQIPNYAQQPSLVNILSLLCQKASGHINEERLKQIEGKYRDSRAELKVLTLKLFPEIEKEPGKEASIRELIRTGNFSSRSTMPGSWHSIEDELFPDIATATGERLEDLMAFRAVCKKLHERHLEINAMFGELAEDILVHLFPNRFIDMEIPGFLKLGFNDSSVADLIYTYLIKDSLVAFLQESYEPLEDDVTRKDAWKSELQERIGAPDLKPVIEAPSAFAVAFVKDYIQSSPDAGKLVAEALNTVVPRPAIAPGGRLAEEQMARLSQEQLANWFVESAQAMLNTDDPHLSGLGRFVNNGLNNLTLALLSKGANLVIPVGTRVEENQFIKELTDRLTVKMGDSKSMIRLRIKFGRMLNDLPLPPFLKEILVPLVNKKTKSLQSALQIKRPAYKELRKLFTETAAEVRGFQRGGELLSISEKISEQIMEQLLQKPSELVSQFDLGDTFEELLTQYLPGVKIDDDLKTWFKGNISALGNSQEGVTTALVHELKQGVQTLILKALMNMIDTNFDSNSEDYAAQLLHNIHQAFIKAISGFDKQQRDKLQIASEIQADIQEIKKEIDALKQELAKKPAGLTAAQSTLIDEALQANMRYIRAKGYLVGLNVQLDAALNELNKNFSEEDKWLESELPFVGKALALHRIKASLFPSMEAYKANLEAEISDLGAAEESEDAQKAQALRDAIDTRKTLLNLLEMSSEELEQLSNAVNADATIRHAEQAMEKLKSALEIKRTAVDEHELEKLTNRPQWDKAVVWLDNALPAREKLHRLTQEVADLNKDLDSHLKIFQVLAHELTALVGLGDDDLAKLPSFLQDPNVLKLIESAKNEHIARLLFEQLTPVILAIADVQKNKDRLIEISQGDQFLVQLATTVSKEVVNRLSEFVTNYHPFAEQILKILGTLAPTQYEIARMEASLRMTMIEIGCGGVKASMLQPLLKGRFSEDQAEGVSVALAQWCAADVERELTTESMLALLKKELYPVDLPTQKEEEQLQNNAVQLARAVNEFLINRGKEHLDPRHLLDAYENLEPGMAEIENREEALRKLDAEKVVERIKTVVITHDEIAHALNEIIPGAKDLHALIAPQLEAVIIGQDDALKANRQFIQDYIESVLLRRFVKIGEANLEEGQSILTVLAGKLSNMIPKAEELVGKSAEEVAQQMIDQALKDVLGFESADDLDGIPMIMRGVGFAKMKEQFYRQLVPLILPMIEREQNKAKLKDLSGSPFLGHLCEALSKDLFTLLPPVVNSYRGIAKELFVLLVQNNPTDNEIDQFALEITELLQRNKQFPITSLQLAQACAKAANLDRTPEALQVWAKTLDQHQALNAILNVLISPEQIAALIGQAIPTVDAKLLQGVADQIQNFVHGNHQAYQHLSVFASAYTEGVLLKIFIRVAEKNPPQNGKDSFVILTEKLLDEAAAKIQEAKDRPAEVIRSELREWMMVQLLGIDSPAVFEGLPDPLKVIAYQAIRDELGGLFFRIQQGLTTLESSDQKVSDAQIGAKRFGIADAAVKSYAQILSEDLAEMVMTSVPDVLSEIGTHHLRGVNAISKGIESYLEELERGNLAVASVLLNYSGSGQFKDLLGDRSAKLADRNKQVDEKKKAVDLLANFILVPLNRILEKTVNFEREKGEAFNQKLMANVLIVAAGHFRNLNDAKELAANAGRAEILHEDFVAAAGQKLHAAVPIVGPSFDESIQLISDEICKKLTPGEIDKWRAEQENLGEALSRLVREEGSGKIVMSIDDVIGEVAKVYLRVKGRLLEQTQVDALKKIHKDKLPLKDLIRKEAAASVAQRQQAAYAPAIGTIMQMIFPKGKEDLTFVPEELRGQVWRTFESNLFPVILPMMTELLLDPDMINTMVLRSLETMTENLQGPIVFEPGEPADRPLDALDNASGALMKEMFKMMKLPDWIKKQIVDPKTNEVSPAMQTALGATLRAQFNNTFIKDKIALSLEKMVARDRDGNYVLKYDTAPSKEKAEKAAANREAAKAGLKKVTRELVDVSISYFIRSKWAEAQFRFDELVAKIPYKIGTKVKAALDAVFGFIFFKIVGTLLALLFSPVKKFVKEKIYDLINLDENREILLSLLTRKPDDQPAEAGHVMYHEDLIYRLGQAIKDSIDECLNEPVLPVAAVNTPHGQ